MMSPAPAGVKGTARPQSKSTPPNQPAPKIGVAFAAVPLDVLKNRNLSPSARLAFAALANQARMKRGEVSTYTNRKLAEAAGLSVAAARRALDELEAAGLIRRLFGPTKRIRLAVAITYQPAGEVAQPSATQPGGVAQPERQGCAPGSPEVAQPGATDLLRGGEKDSESPSLAHQGAEEPNPDGPAAAAYLRACVTAARLGLEMPAPPSGVTATKDAAPSPAPVVASNAASPSQDKTPNVMRRIVASLTDRLTNDVLDVRPPSRSGRRRRRG